MNTMQIKYDPDANASYVTLAEGVYSGSVVVDDGFLAVDVDAERRPLGVEFLCAPVDFTPEMLAKIAERFPAIEGDLRRALAGVGYRAA